MINEASLNPKPQNNNAKIAFLLAILISAIGFVTYFSIDRYRGIVGLFALFTLVTAILFYTKYISPEFHYDITHDSENTPIFVVRQIIGKRQTTLCRIDLSDIKEIRRVNKSERRAHKTPSGYRKYVYSPTLFPSEVFILTVIGRYERAEIIIEGDGGFVKLLEEGAAEARQALLSEE